MSRPRAEYRDAYLDLTPAEVERFAGRITRPDENGCRRWTGETNGNGYGRFNIYRQGRRLRLLTHRLALTLATGRSLDGLVARHTCDNAVCCEPTHLIPGTQRDNVLDAVVRGRWNGSGLAEHRAARTAARVARERASARGAA